MTKALSSIVESRSPLILTNELWDEAIFQASCASGTRHKPNEETPGERMRRLREMIEQELVAFHDELIVNPYEGEQQPRKGASLWSIGIPLTLFPKRDRGFTRIECIVEFCSENENNDNNIRIRVISISPEPRSELIAYAKMGANLELKTRAKLRLPLPSASGISIAEVGGSIYGKMETVNMEYKAIRMCVETEIIRGSQARWRLEDPKEPEKFGIESHQLGVILEVENKVVPVDAAGYLQAYSDTRWLTSSLGSFWRDFSGRLKNLFQRGLPTEGYAEWKNVIPV
ncbi:MAG: hypothetical protein ACFFCW_45525 [Candidatus Hodarchaeota archaeon]